MRQTLSIERPKRGAKGLAQEAQECLINITLVAAAGALMSVLWWQVTGEGAALAVVSLAVSCVLLSTCFAIDMEKGGEL